MSKHTTISTSPYEFARCRTDTQAIRIEGAYFDKDHQGLWLEYINDWIPEGFDIEVRFDKHKSEVYLEAYRFLPQREESPVVDRLVDAIEQLLPYADHYSETLNEEWNAEAMAAINNAKELIGRL